MNLQGPLSRRLAEMQRAGLLAESVLRRSTENVRVYDVSGRVYDEPVTPAAPLPQIVPRPPKKPLSDKQISRLTKPPRGDRAKVEGIIAPKRCVSHCQKVQYFTSKFYGYSVQAIVGEARHWDLSAVRQVAMYVSKVTSHLSYPQIGRVFGNRDHTTVIHACRKVHRLMVSDEDFAQEVAALIMKCAPKVRENDE